MTAARATLRGAGHIVVCGGGLAGIAAAVEAARRGARVTLVERRPFLGGRAFSFTDRASGHEVDNGQHVFMGCCPAYIDLLRILGTGHHTTLQRRLHAPVRDRDGRTGALWGAPLPAPLHLAPAFLRYPHLTAREKASAARALAALARLTPADRTALDDVTFAAWLEERGQGPRAIANFWDLIVLPTCNDRSDRVSAGLAAFVFHEGFLRTAGGAAIGWSRVGLSRLVDPAAETLLAGLGGRVLRGREVAAAEPGRVRLRDGETLAADGVVLALPPSRVLATAPEALAADPQLGDSPIVSAHVWYDRPVMPETFSAVIDSPVQWAFNRTAMTGDRGEGHQVAVTMSGARREVTLPRDELERLVQDEIAALYPAARAATVLACAVIKEPRATFAAAPGQAARRPGVATAMHGVALAGAWTDTGWPATMEGAVRSGIAAARHLLD